MSEDHSGAGDRRAMAQDCARTVTSWPKHGVELRGTVVQLQVGPVSGRGDGGGRAGEFWRRPHRMNASLPLPQSAVEKVYYRPAQLQGQTSPFRKLFGRKLSAP